VLAIPPKRFDRRVITFLTEPEIDALLAAPERTTWTGRRDHALLVLAVQAGLRASELTGLCCGDVHLGTGAHLTVRGKGRKERVAPLTNHTRGVLRAWLDERDGRASEPVFPTARGGRLSRDALERRLSKHLALAGQGCPTLAAKPVTMHVLRHTAAMRLLHADIDSTVIALWLGHESVDTTKIYLHADLELRQKAIARTTPPTTEPGRYRPPDTLLAFLEGL